MRIKLNHRPRRAVAGRLWPAVLVAVLAGLLAACGASPDAAAQAGETVEVIVGDLAANATASGVLRASREATLDSPTTGRVTAVLVR
ncbi:MAG: hypothetical protein K1X50_15945, partial [Candidatus Promineofilum sp.]|nr:hypothetical protein [Promineifilum sp.]